MGSEKHVAYRAGRMLMWFILRSQVPNRAFSNSCFFLWVPQNSWNKEFWSRWLKISELKKPPSLSLRKLSSDGMTKKTAHVIQYDFLTGLLTNLTELEGFCEQKMLDILSWQVIDIVKRYDYEDWEPELPISHAGQHSELFIQLEALFKVNAWDLILHCSKRKFPSRHWNPHGNFDCHSLNEQYVQTRFWIAHNCSSLGKDKEQWLWPWIWRGGMRICQNPRNLIFWLYKLTFAAVS